MADTESMPVLQLPPKRFRRTWVPVAVVLTLVLVVVVGVIWGRFAAREHKREANPIVSARRVFNPIASGDAHALKGQIDDRHRRAAAQAVQRFFRGWSMDARSLRIVERADDNAYVMGFTAYRPSGAKAVIRGNLWPQGRDGGPPWKLRDLWVDGGAHRKARDIFPRAG